MPSASARSTARLVGAEIATSVEAPNRAVFSIISYEARLVMSIKPLCAFVSLRISAPMVLSSALWHIFKVMENIIINLGVCL